MYTYPDWMGDWGAIGVSCVFLYATILVTAVGVRWLWVAVHAS